MKYNICDETTKNLIDSLGEEYKDLLVEVALRESRQYDIQKLDTDKINGIDKKIKYTLKRKTKRFDYTFILSEIGMIGALFALMGLLLPYTSKYVMPNVELSSTTTSVMAIVGTITTILAYSVSIIMFDKNSQSFVTYDIVNKWNEIEALIRELSPQSETISLKAMLNNLSEDNIVSADDVELLEQLLRIRNDVVHNKSSMSRSKCRKLIMQSNPIILKLKRAVAKINE